MTARVLGLYSPAPQSGKSTVAAYLRLRHDMVIRPFAAAVKRVARAFAYELGMTPGQVDVALAGDKTTEIYPGVSMRRVLQTLGTDWARLQIGGDVWVRCWRAKIEPDLMLEDGIVADDVRFENEASKIHRLGGEVWGIVRPGAQGAGSHASEAGLPREAVDRWILNDADQPALYAQVDHLLAARS